MLTKYAQEIAEATGRLVKGSVLITDTNAVIIGCTDPERIGRVHSPSIPVMKFGKETFDDENAAKMLGVKPGVTLPYFFLGRIVGSIAVAGNPEVVRPFALLIREQAESMLRERLFIQKAYEMNKNQENLINEIINFNPIEVEARFIIEKAKKVGIDLNRTRISICFEIFRFRGVCDEKNKILDNNISNDPFKSELSIQLLRKKIYDIIFSQFKSQQDFGSYIKNDTFLLLNCVNDHSESEDLIIHNVIENCNHICHKVREFNVELLIGIGSLSFNLFEIPFSFSEATQTIEIAKKISPTPGVYHIKDFQLEHILLGVEKRAFFKNQNQKIIEIQKQPDGENLLRDYVTWCDNFFNTKKTSESLEIHRNTLSYRLQKIKDITQIKDGDFKGFISLYLAILSKTLNK